MFLLFANGNMIKYKTRRGNKMEMDSCEWTDANLLRCSSKVQLGGYLEQTKKTMGGLYISLGLGMSQDLSGRAGRGD